MDDEMIERVAEAIHNNWQATGKGPAHRTWQETNDKLPGQADSFRLYAKAAIQAMREPTDEMADAAPNAGNWTRAKDDWRAMIDALAAAEFVKNDGAIGAAIARHLRKKLTK